MNLAKRIIATIGFSIFMLILFFGFISPIISSEYKDLSNFSFSTITMIVTVLICVYQLNHDDLNRQKEREQILEDKRRKIYPLLKFSYIQTNESTKYIKNFYKRNFINLVDQNGVFLLERYNLTGNILDDYGKIININSDDHKEIYYNLLRQMSQILLNNMKNRQI